MYKNCKNPEWAKEITNISTKEDKQPILEDPKPKPKAKKVPKYESSESDESESEESEDECIPVKQSVNNPFSKFL